VVLFDIKKNVNIQRIIPCGTRIKKPLLSVADISLFLQRRQKASRESLNREQGNL
jgi:hypothetical protein